MTDLLRSSKNAFIMQSKSTFLEFFYGNSSLQIWPLRKILQGQILQVQMTSLQIDHVLCLSHVFPLRYRGGLFVCRVSLPVIRVWWASLLCGLLSRKWRCLRLAVWRSSYWHFEDRTVLDAKSDLRESVLVICLAFQETTYTKHLLPTEE